ncbi:hypothetical protein GOBAR_DD06806 [Gossypium barbadense]|nr:hypothetical protein GOBAR_DD06806 [Gossypium barbadense]
MISAKIIRCCGRRISKLFYKFAVSTNPIKFIEMKLVNNENIETMVTLYCRNQNGHTELIQLFDELADVESTEDFTPLSKEHGVQDPCTEVSRVSVDRWSSIHEFDINLNAPPMFENLNLGPRLQIHPVVIEIDADDYSDPDLDKVPDDIDDEDVNNDGNIYSSLVENLSRGIGIHNDLKAHMSVIDPDTTHAFDFPEYLDILPAH